MAVYKITKKHNKMLVHATPVEFLSILLEQPFYNSIKLARITVKTELLALKGIPGETIDENNFTCPICLFVLCNPVVLSCAHRFCWTCLSKTSESVKSCPVCRKDLQLDPKNFSIDWILKEFLHQQFPDSQADSQTPKIARDGLIKQLESRAISLVTSSQNNITAAEIPTAVRPVETAPAPQPIQAPKVADCKYNIVEMLGKGVFGEVYLANLRSDPSAPPVALKKIPKNHPKFKKSALVREMNAGRSLRHEGIIRFIESFETLSSIYFVLEYFDGKDLYSIIEERNYKPFSEPTAKDVFRQLISAVFYCHHKGIAHRDIKLENIMMNKSGKIVLIDFGLCDQVIDVSNGAEKLCSDSVGSPAYIAPEVLTGNPYHAFKADVWSLGVVLYAMVFGKFPYSPAQYKHLVEGERVLIEFPTFGSNSVKDVVRSTLSLNPNDRPSLQKVMSHEWISGLLTKTPVQMTYSSLGSIAVEH